jgi:hypothetical protein
MLLSQIARCSRRELIDPSRNVGWSQGYQTPHAAAVMGAADARHPGPNLAGIFAGRTRRPQRPEPSNALP